MRLSDGTLLNFTKEEVEVNGVIHSIENFVHKDMLFTIVDSINSNSEKLSLLKTLLHIYVNNKKLAGKSSHKGCRYATKKRDGKSTAYRYQQSMCNYIRTLIMEVEFESRKEA